ncbi:MAG: ATP-binding cassette domain-containing protein, partial [Pyrinomonadaceae bacterium]|nr:ATP-binding cassette domain-containing protein [Pyrinomonadaceae bacterium]
MTFNRARKEYATENGTVVALAGLELEIDKGETICLIGTSGSGKTTALKMINRLV